MKIIPLSEGQFTVDQSKKFVPFDEGNHDLQQRSAGSLLVEVQPFVVITSHDILLLDTGLGFEKQGILQLHSNLVNAGINPAEVTKVLLSHLHKDHAGGIGAGLVPSFSSAYYYVQKNELAFAYEKGAPSYIRHELESLRNNKQVILLDGDGFIEDTIRYEITGAHSPFHQVFWIKENDKTVFYGGDEAPQLHQMKHRFTAKYDYDGRKAMHLRQQWREEGEKEKWNFLFYHDVKNPVFQF